MKLAAFVDLVHASLIDFVTNIYKTSPAFKRQVPKLLPGDANTTSIGD